MSAPFDAVLILGKELRHDPERATRELKARCAAASAAYRAGARFIATLEAKLQGQEETGSALVERWLLELGVPPSGIVRQNQTRSTREEAVLGAALFREQRVGRGLVLTARYHVTRARWHFDDLGANVAVHAPESLWRLANDQERAWITDGIPTPETEYNEGKVELTFMLGARLMRPLPQALRNRLEIQAGAWFRGVMEE